MWLARPAADGSSTWPPDGGHSRPSAGRRRAGTACILQAVTPGRASDQQLAAFSIPSARGNERIAIVRVAEAVRGLGLSAASLERLKTAVAEATLNAMEHGNHFQPDQPVTITVARSANDLIITVVDSGGPVPAEAISEPDLEAKLAEKQSPRGWGLFLIRHMVDELIDECRGQQHSVELHVRLGEGR
jgi:anti-sigma regulatory factor (Ser/Thr protein kinase)